MQHLTPDSNSSVIGVGLRHPHFNAALTAPAAIDFVEIHSENYFVEGGALKQVLLDIAQQYAISLHSTSLGLGSAAGIPDDFLAKLKFLTQQVPAFLVSDHAAFTWAYAGQQLRHSGDLLPLVYSNENLMLMVENIDRVQQVLGRQILVENLSAYLHLPGSTMQERDFLLQLTQLSGCGLLLDLNNILVNAVNNGEQDPLSYARQWVAAIPSGLVQEIHLAGCTTVEANAVMIDDHAQAVSAQCWQLYRSTIQQLGNVATLIEWDNNLPSWPELVNEAAKARLIADKALKHE